MLRFRLDFFQILLSIYLLHNLVGSIASNCACGNTSLPNCCSDECGDYCKTTSCFPYNTICNSIPQDCQCILTNCYNGTTGCSGYVRCKSDTAKCSNSNMLINGAFCQVGNVYISSKSSTNFTVFQI